MLGIDIDGAFTLLGATVRQAVRDAQGRDGVTIGERLEAIGFLDEVWPKWKDQQHAIHNYSKRKAQTGAYERITGVKRNEQQRTN